METDEYREQRERKRTELEALGYAPYGSAFARTGRLAQIRSSFREDARVRAAGRLVTIRAMGKSQFADLRDGTDRFQIYVQKNGVGEAAFQAFKLLDLGDTIGVEGTLFTTRTGEQTLKVESWTLLAKALRPPPEKWHGLKDVEARYRQRYLDLMANPEARARFTARARALRSIRAYLDERGFVEVETPMLQAQAGGAAARPFVTHYGALNTDVYLRIAPELYLKRLLVGGFDKVYELNRNFRNEGLSRTHNPEFTMLELYEAYADVRGMQELVTGLITHTAETVTGSLRAGTEEQPIDLTPPWREVPYADLIRENAGPDWFELDREAARKRAEGLGLSIDPGWDLTLITHEVYEKRVEGALRQPTFVTRFPAALIPLARACEDDAAWADVFELVIGGQEIAPAYTELNDPAEQRRRLEHQAGTEPEKVDEDFLTALEYGMPPAGGMGVGIDRLLMVLTGAEAIRDVILFPQLRPKDT
ncbi:MAG: lysine--tRNA ligase [Lentisphaerae bacterium]|nr:lysine--tRNA ligase [Lentisphaerota bacterium]